MMTSDAKRALAKTIRELREKIILPDLREPPGTRPGGSLSEPSSAEGAVNQSTRSASACSRSSATSNSASVGRWQR